MPEPGRATTELPASDPLRLFTVDEVAELLRYHPATVNRWCQEEKIPFRNILGAGRRFTRTDIEQILADGERGPR